MSKVRRAKYVEPPEESIPLRVTNALIIVTCITVACMYAELPLFQTFLYVWFAITGCYTSFYFRHGKHLWLTGCIIGGLLIVVLLFAHDLLQEFDIGHLENFAPFLAVIAGMQTVHAYDLQTRSDINVSTVLSLLLFTMTAVIGRDLLFGFFVMALVVLGSALLYFEAVARTKSNQGSTQLSQAEVTVPFPTQSRRMASGSAVLPIAALPVLTLILFAGLPRVDSMFDVLLAKFHPSPIKVDDKGFNFMSGTGKGPGKGKNGEGAGVGPSPGQKKDQTQAQNKDKTEKNDNNRAGNSSGANPNANASKDGTGGASSGKDGKDSKESKEAKAGQGAGGDGKDKSGKDGKSNTGSADSKDGKDGKQGGGTGSASSKSDNKKDGDKSNTGGQGGPGGDKKAGQDPDGKGGSGSGKGKRHGEGVQGGYGDSGDEQSEDPATKERLANTHLDESDELVFRNKETADFDDSVFMKVRSEQPVYLKRTVFDKYDGKHWSATIKTKPAVCEKGDKEWTELGGVPQLFVSSEQKFTLVQQVITADIGLGRIIPAASVPTRVDMGKDMQGVVSVDDYGILRAEKNIEKGTVFKIQSKIPSFDLKKMHEADRDPVNEKKILAEQAIYLQLPENLPKEIKQLTQEIVIADDNYFNRADRICKHLRTHFKYSSDVYRANDSEDLVSHFLFKKKEGACGEFSSAFVVMCRLAGIPAREVGGYAPGTSDGRTGRREVTGLDGHAWGEVCIPNVGWVPFDATPTGTMPENSVKDDSWFASIKRTFESAEAAFQLSQQDRNIGKGSEDDYKVAAQQPKASQGAKTKESNAAVPGPAQPADNAKEQHNGSKEDGSASKPKAKEDLDGVSPLGHSNSGGEAEVLAPTEKVKTEKVDTKSFVLTWQEIAFVVALIPFAFLLIRFGLARMRRRSQDNRSANYVSPSTALYLKMVEDLKRLKILRKPSDTTDELSRRFSELIEIDERIHPELEGLFLDFIELYAQERFSEEGHNAENYKDLREIGNRIHTLSKTRLEKRRS